MTQELMTAREFQQRFAISHSEFYRQVSAKRIRITKIGRATRISRADAEAWLASLPTSREEVNNDN